MQRIDGLKSDESNVIMCKHGMRIVAIENSSKGVFLYGTRRTANIDSQFVDTATALTLTKYPTNDCYSSADVSFNLPLPLHLFDITCCVFSPLQLSAKALAFHAETMYQCLLDRHKCSKPIIYAGEVGWHAGLVSINPDNVTQGKEVADILEDQPQPFASILKLSSRELYLDILPLVS